MAKHRVDTITLKLRAFVNAKQPVQRVGVSLNGRKVADWVLKNGEVSGNDYVKTIPIPQDIDVSKPIRVQFDLPDAASPKSLGLSGDTRDLAIGLEALSFAGAGFPAAPAAAKPATQAPAKASAPATGGGAPSFAAGGDATSLLATGWSHPEKWGTWSDAASATLALPASAGGQRLTLHFRAFVNAKHSSQRIGVSLNGQTVGDWTVKAGETRDNQWDKTIDLPKAGSGAQSLKLTFDLPDAASPKDLGLSGDPRALAVGLETMRLSPAR